MRLTDRKIKRKIKAEHHTAPNNFTKTVDTALNTLPERKKSSLPFYMPRILKSAAAFLVLLFLLLPNLNHNLAQAMEQLPIVGQLVKVITIRNYFYSDDKHEADVRVPELETDGENSGTDSAAALINADVKELTDTLLERFESDLKEIGNQAHFSLKVDYEVLSNTDQWFTLKINVYEGAGSSNTYFKLYHIDKTTGKIMQLSDLFKEDTDYLHAISENIRSQMIEQMQENENVYYWVNAEYPEWNFSNIRPDQNFYFAENGNIVILFDKYEVAPGAMGTPQFEIPQSVYAEYLK